ncbi:hypothetical protein IVB14_32135 [Bradyrhizobium sp. 180]|uniref:DUF6647 family protein n=1 Tax=Bradyrhizobium sp. 180 TaxID=2782650 RepID=UPI001FFBE31A|nr:DUF6647 family protein [Bradyrhizobium sp. 180]MCK1494934.1 hypothetical protein [Bradyrhizobium sp. 180]
MFKRLILFLLVAVLAVAGSSPARCQSHPGQLSAESYDASRAAQDVLGEIADWLVTNMGLPIVTDRPTIRFVSKDELAKKRGADSAQWQGSGQYEGIDRLDQRNVIALYDNSSKTILLPDDWQGTSPAEQSMLVHEMVHHIQNVAGLKLECPIAREKAAYLAQDEWLKRLGKSLESEFDVDLFTILISSACMY